MRHVTALGMRSMALGVFAMVHAFVGFARGDNSVIAFGVIATVVGILHFVSAAASPGAHRPFFQAAGAVGVGVGLVSVGAGVVIGPVLFPWVLGVFGIVTGAAELLAAGRSPTIPRNDHRILGGVTVILGLASLLEAGIPDWLSGTLVAWAAIGAVVAGTASVQWRDELLAANNEGGSS